MSGWQPPSALPDLRRAGIIALDTETNDDGLRADRGSGWPWRDGHICGVGIAYRAEWRDLRALFPDPSSRQQEFRSASRSFSGSRI